MNEEKVKKISEEQRLVQDKFNYFIKNHLLDVVIILFAAIYIARGFTTFKESEKTWLEILADSALYFIFATVLKALFSTKGIRLGMADEKFIQTQCAYGKQLEDISEEIDHLQDFCDYKNERNLNTEKNKILFSYGVSRQLYDSWVDGVVTLPSKVAVLEQANEDIKKIKIFMLKAQDLTSEGATKLDYGFGMGIGDYYSKSLAINVFMSLASAFIFGFYMLKLLEEPSLANLIWYGLQSVSMLVFGVLAMSKAVSFVLNDYRNRYIRKTNDLIEFKVWYNRKGDSKNGNNNGQSNTVV